MRLKFLYISLILLIQYTAIHAQESLLDKKISLKCKNKKISEVLSDIERENQLYFSYSNNRFPADSLITIKIRNKPINEVLKQILDESEYEYIVVDNQIILKKRESIQPIDLYKKFTLSGFIKDQATGEPVIGASIYIPEIKNGTLTNAYGFYSLSLPAGNYTPEISYMGYRKNIQRVTLNKNTKLSLPLEYNVQTLTVVVVEGTEKENIIEKSQMSELKVKAVTLSNMPAFMGSPDLLKSAQFLPGILPHGDGSSFFYVRGGHRDQNLILIDDAPVYSTSHLFGFFTSIVPEAINDVKIYKGDFPVSYGGRISSVMDIHTREGNSNHFGVDANIGLFTSRICIQGPIVKEKSSYFLSLRKSNMAWLTSKDKNLNIFFNDVNFKINGAINHKNKLYFSFYSGNDNITSQNSKGTSGFIWNNFTTSFRWNHIYNEKLFQNLILYSSNYNNNLLIGDNNTITWKSDILQTGIKLDYSYYYNPSNTFRFGGGITNYNFNPGNLDINTSVINAAGYNETPHKIAQDVFLYAGGEKKINEKFSIHYGFRLVSWNNIGPTKEFVYNQNHEIIDVKNYEKLEKYNSYLDLEPRAGMKYFVDSSSSVKIGYSRITQHLQMLNNSMSPLTTMEVWYPAGPNIKPQKSDQVVAGYFRNLSHSIIFSAETYYKRMYNQIEYRDNANTLLNPYIESELRFGTANAYGLELMLKKEKGRFTGWASYTLSRVRRTINEVNGNVPYAPFNDRLHSLALCMQYELTKYWVLSSNWIYASGAAISTPSSFFNYQGYQVPIYSSRNNDRLPAYRRFDVSVMLRLNPNHKRRFEHAMILSVYNVFNRSNPMLVAFNKTQFNDQSLGVPMNTLNKSLLVPTTLALSGFIPSINYTLRF